MTPGARVAAAIAILDRVLAGEPAEKALTNWARASRYAGSKDRAAVRDHVFGALRRRRSLGWVGGGATGRALMIGACRLDGVPENAVFTGEGYAPAPLGAEEAAAGRPLEAAPEAVRLDVPDWIPPRVVPAPGGPASVLTPLRERAPVFLRANLLKATREAALAALARDGIEGAPHPLAGTAIEVTGGARKVAASRAYREGLVELQDAASQAVAERLAAAAEGARVLDYCAGGGGKALALAALGAREVVAHDADPGRMRDVPARAARAGAPIAVSRAPGGGFDLVLCDVPCSGSGAWRRQPEARWRLTESALARLHATQDAVLDAACGHAAPGGVLAYATCSVLACENGVRRAAFARRHPGAELLFERQFLPEEGGDGLYVAAFRIAAGGLTRG